LPFSSTEAVALPLVASLLTEIEPLKVSAAVGAKSTVTESGEPLG